MCDECKLIYARRLYEKRLRDLQLGAFGEPSKECPQAPASATALLTATATAVTALSASGCGSTANAARNPNTSAGGAKAKRDRSRVGKSGKADQQSPPNWPPRVTGGGGGTSTNHSVSQLIGGRLTPAPGLGLGLGVGRVPVPVSPVGLGVCMEVGRGVGVGVGGGDSACSGFFCGGLSDNSFPFAGVKQSSPFALDYSPGLGLLAGHHSRASCGGGGGALSSTALFGLNPLPPPFPFAVQAPCWSSVVSGVLNYKSDMRPKGLVLHCVHFWRKQIRRARASRPQCRALDCPSGRAVCSAAAPGSTCNSSGRLRR